jgi:hypothetical protein
MSVADNSPGAGVVDPAKDLESAARTFQVVRTKQATGSPPDLITFASSLNFLLTVGYLTKPQADALLACTKFWGRQSISGLRRKFGS